MKDEDTFTDLGNQLTPEQKKEMMDIDAKDHYEMFHDETMALPLTEEELEFLSQIDSYNNTEGLDDHFTDEDMIFNSRIMNEISRNHGHANNVESCKYTYLINVYEKDVVSSTFKYTRIYEFSKGVTQELSSLFTDAGATLLIRSETQCFGSNKMYDIDALNLETRSAFVCDLIVPAGFDIDATHYYHNSCITSFDPWTMTDEKWSNVVHEGFVDSLPNRRYLEMTSTSPNHLDTRTAMYIGGISDKK